MCWLNMKVSAVMTGSFSYSRRSTTIKAETKQKGGHGHHGNAWLPRQKLIRPVLSLYTFPTSKIWAAI